MRWCSTASGWCIKSIDSDYMSTNSRIALELSDGSFLSAYHHWDGYPEWLGSILNTHYADRESVSELIDGGDMSAVLD